MLSEACVYGKGFEKCSQEKSWIIWLHLRWLCIGLKSPAQLPALGPVHCWLTSWLAGVQWLSCPEGSVPPHSHQTTIMIMQMHSEKAWGTTIYQAELGLFEVIGLCQFQLTQFSVLILFIYLPGNCSFFVKTLRQRQENHFGENNFSQGPSGYRSWQREGQRMISVSIIMAHHCPLGLRVEDIFPGRL